MKRGESEHNTSVDVAIYKKARAKGFRDEDCTLDLILPCENIDGTRNALRWLRR